MASIATGPALAESATSRIAEFEAIAPKAGLPDEGPTMSLMRIAMQRHTAMFMSNMIGGLTQTQFATMAKLHEIGPCSQNELGRRVFLDGATIKGVIDRLRRRALVRTRPARHDMRLHIVSLTTKGQNMSEAAIGVAKHVNAMTLEPMTFSERQTLTLLLKKLAKVP
jgi:DNA-binding MarR family transcriptional regulator